MRARASINRAGNMNTIIKSYYCGEIPLCRRSSLHRSLVNYYSIWVKKLIILPVRNRAGDHLPTSSCRCLMPATRQPVCSWSWRCKPRLIKRLTNRNRITLRTIIVRHNYPISQASTPHYTISRRTRRKNACVVTLLVSGPLARAGRSNSSSNSHITFTSVPASLS